ncbi:MAG: TfoX/Sxy family protein [Betaproteobacteria bacterium]|nr:TfoX/Sxy family protein [Betaproteobacteria bacterium]
MAYDEALATRVRCLLKTRKQISEKRMFGGLAFMLGDKMCCGVLKDDFVARIGTAAYEAALAEPHVRPMDFTGRPLKGYVYVGPQATRSDSSLKAWVDRSVAFTSSLLNRTKPRKKH